MVNQGLNRKAASSLENDSDATLGDGAVVDTIVGDRGASDVIHVAVDTAVRITVEESESAELEPKFLENDPVVSIFWLFQRVTAFATAFLDGADCAAPDSSDGDASVESSVVNEVVNTS